MQVPADGHVYAGGQGRKWCLPALSFLEKPPNDLCSFSTHSEFSEQLSREVFFKMLLLCCISMGLFIVLSL